MRFRGRTDARWKTATLLKEDERDDKTALFSLGKKGKVEG